MSPSPSGPYQSRFIRSLLSQTRRWLDRGQQAVRNVQVAAGWSVQILLYPVYALFQTTRLVGEQIGKVAQPEFPRLKVPATEQTGVTVSSSPALSADRPLQRVLQTVQSFAMTPMPIALQQTEVVIRGIAMQLEGRSLVLVTEHNQVLNILTPEQQQVLQQRLFQSVANDDRNSDLWRLPRWIGGKLRRLFGLAPSKPPLPAPAGSSLALTGAAALQVDAPVWQSLVTVQQVLATTENQEQATQLAIATALTPASTVFVRGIASLLEERSLVLVTNQNQLLDVLTCEQQAKIQRRMIWEVANYYRYVQLRRRAQGLIPPRLPAISSQAWFPVRAFQGLMAWMQTGPIAIATNLFQEASLPAAASWPEADALPRLPDGNTPALPGWFQKLQTSLITFLNPSPQSTDGQTSFRPQPSSLAPSSLASVINRPATVLQSNGNKPLAGAEGRSPEFIETDVTVIGYELSWLERIVRWLDRCFVWVESVWSRLVGGSSHQSSRPEDE